MKTANDQLKVICSAERLSITLRYVQIRNKHFYLEIYTRVKL